MQAFGDLVQFDSHDRRERRSIERSIDERLEAREQRRLEMRDELRMNGLTQRGLCDRGVLGCRVVDLRTAEIGRHHDHAVAEIDLAPLAVAHRAPVEYLIEDVEYIAMRFLDFIQQHDAVWTLAHCFSKYAAAPVADVAGRRALELRYRVRFLILGQVDGRQRGLAAEQQIGERQRGLGLADAGWPGQQEDAERRTFEWVAGMLRHVEDARAV